MAAARSPRSNIPWTVISTSLFLALCGCGSHPHVAGKVSYKDKNLTSGLVSFVGKDGKKHAASILSDGSYKLIEPPIGQVKVGVEVKPPITVSQGNDKAKAEKPPPSPIPVQYADPNKSGLTTEIKEGANTYDIPLK